MLKIQMLEQIMNNEGLDEDKERATNSRANTLLLGKSSSVSLQNDSNWSMTSENTFGAIHPNALPKSGCLHNSEINHSTNACETNQKYNLRGVENTNLHQHQTRNENTKTQNIPLRKNSYESSNLVRHSVDSSINAWPQKTTSSATSLSFRNGFAYHNTQNNSSSYLLELLRSANDSRKLPMVVKPKSYWIDCGELDGNDEIDGNSNNDEKNQTKLKIELNDAATIYRQHFINSEHSNLIGYDDAKNPVLISMKPESIANKDYTRVLLRQTTGTMHEILPRFSTETNASPKQISALLNDRLKVQQFEAVVYPMASNLIAAYDEYHLIMNFKFGILYQKYGQVFEEELFSNNDTSPEFKEFLSLLGKKIELKNHKGYRGGLDVQNGHTGDSTFYEVFEDREIIFHVSTMLPFSNNDQQQLQRKRHIGNDIVAIVFQEENTPFSPDMIASHFLHAFIVIQPYKDNAYRCAVVCRQGVPFFGPPLPKHGVISKKCLKKFLLTKLINAENACYKAEKFANLEYRTRSSLLSNLVEDLRAKTNTFLGVEPAVEPENNSGSNRFIETVRKAFISRVKSQSTADNSTGKGQNPTGNQPQRYSSNASSISWSRSYSADPPTPTIKEEKLEEKQFSRFSYDKASTVSNEQQSENSSLSSVELENPVNEGDSQLFEIDLGFGSMSLSEQSKVINDEDQHQNSVDELVMEIKNLKEEKLDLLRQNVICQRDMKRLREQEHSLEEDLSRSRNEILHLRKLLKDVTMQSESFD